MTAATDYGKTVTVRHPIDRYVEEAGITRAEFARRVGLSPQFVSDLIAGRYGPGVETAKRIVSKTGGAIRLDELLTWEPPAPTPSDQAA